MLFVVGIITETIGQKIASSMKEDRGGNCLGPQMLYIVQLNRNCHLENLSYPLRIARLFS